MIGSRILDHCADDVPGPGSGVSRRRFITRAAGLSMATGLSLAAGSGWRGTLADDDEGRGRGEKPGPRPSAGPIEGCSPAPVPIPGGINFVSDLGLPSPPFPDRLFHVFLPVPGVEPSTIFHFRGLVAVANIEGTGTRTELDPDTGRPRGVTRGLPYATDVRFMDGDYIGVDGRKHTGTFGFF